MYQQRPVDVLIPYVHHPETMLVDEDDNSPLSDLGPSANYDLFTSENPDIGNLIASVSPVISYHAADLHSAEIRNALRGNGQAGMEAVDDGGLDPILDAEEYYDELDELALKIAKTCNLDMIVAGLPNLSLTECLMLFWGCRDTLEKLQHEHFCGSFFNMFVEDEGRGVADTVYIPTVEINSLIRCIQEQVPDSKIELNRILVCLGQKLRFPAKNALESICKALALGLVSFAVSHVNRFDVETFRKEIGTFNMGSGATFALRELACLGDFVCGPV